MYSVGHGVCPDHGSNDGICERCHAAAIAAKDAEIERLTREWTPKEAKR